MILSATTLDQWLSNSACSEHVRSIYTPCEWNHNASGGVPALTPKSSIYGYIAGAFASIYLPEVCTLFDVQSTWKR